MKIVGRFTKSVGNTAIENRTLLVYELKTCYRVELWNSGIPNWKSRPHKPMSIEKCHKDMEAIRRKFYGLENADIAASV